MSLGSRSRRFGLSCAALTVAGLAGCHAMPVGRLVTEPNRPQTTLASASRVALLPATVAMDPPSEMSSIEPVATPASTITPAEAPKDSITPAPTPLLDAALLRAKGIAEPAAPPSREQAEPSSTGTGPTPPPEIPVPSTAEVPPVVTPPPPSAIFAPSSEAARETEPAKPEELWRDGLRRLGTLARTKLEQPNSAGSAPWNLRARILAWLAEPEQEPDLGQHDREADGVRAVLRALDDSPVDSSRRGDEVRSAVLVLEDRAPLEITDLRFCSKVDGFGDFEVFEPPVRKAGQPVILYCEIDGLRFEPTSAGFRTRVSVQVEILASSGGPPILTKTLNAEETCRRRRRDYYVANKIVLPRPLEPGDYRIRLTARDVTSERSSTREVAFAIAKD